MVEQLKTIDKQIPKQENKQEETLDQVLQSKISDKDSLNKAKPIFEEVQKSFQQPINEYIKKLNKIQLDTIINILPEPVKYLIEDIDLTIGWKIDVTQNKITENKNIIEKQDTLLKARQKTSESYNKLDPKYKPKKEEKDKVEAIKNKISPEKKKALEDAKLDVDAYANFIFTKETHGEELKKENNTEFLDNLENLDKILPKENTTMKETINPDHTNLIVENNGSLSKYTQESRKLNSIASPDLPKSKDFENFDKEFDFYKKLLTDEKKIQYLKDNENIIKEYKKFFEKNQEDAKGMKGEDEYKAYTDIKAEIENNIQIRTKEIIKQRVMGTCITGLAKYFDTTTMNKENFASDFDINTQDGFNIQKGAAKDNERSDDILYINWNIKGNSVGFYYNLTNEDAQLKSDDFLHLDKKSNAFSFSKGSWGKNELGVKLPTINFLTNEAQTIINNDFTDGLKNAKSMGDFETTLKDKISEKLLTYYGQEALVKTRVERDVEKNIMTQKLQSTFFPETVLAELNKEGKDINKTTDKKVWKLLEIRDKSTENMRSDELRRFRSLTERLDPLITRIAKTPQENLEPKRQKLLKDMEQERRAVTYDDKRWAKTLNFFNKFSKNNQMNLEDVEVFINGLEKKENIADNTSQYSPDFVTREEHEEADGLIEQNGNLFA